MDIEFVLPDRDFPDYTPFSESTNPLYFAFTVPYLKERMNEELPMGASKEHFEELVNEAYELQLEYVEHYHPENEYFLTQGRYEGKLQDIYYIARNGEIVMFFIRRSP